MTYDVAVVGAGSAGAVIAARLSEDPGVRVVLIEAGPDYPDADSLPDELKYGHATAAYAVTHGHLWQLTARATDVQGPTPLPRGKVTGGTSAVNGQVFLRGLRDDFRRWEEAGNAGWGFDDVLPAFRKLETDLDFDDDVHGANGPIRVRRYAREAWLPAQEAFFEACRTAGHPACADANAPDARGVGPIPFNNVGGLRASTAATYLAEARGRGNLTILPDTFVRRLVIRSGRVAGIEVEAPGGSQVVEAAEVVLSAGAIGSPHLLLLSGVGPHGDLRAAGIPPNVALPGVGRNLADHQLVDLVWESDASAAFGAAPPRVQVALRYTSTGSARVDDMQITVRSAAPGHAESSVSLAPAIELPEATGEVSLVSVDPHVQPSIELRFLSEPGDRHRLREGVQMCLELAGDGAFEGILGRRLSPSEADVASPADFDRWLLENIRTSHHVCGTCRMGPDSDPAAVVNRYGVVHGIANLRVADASIFPQVIGANVNATTMMVGERMAEFIRGGRR